MIKGMSQKQRYDLKMALREDNPNNQGCDDPYLIKMIGSDRRTMILETLDNLYSRQSGYNHSPNSTSYGLKQSLPFYIYNGEFKGAMLMLGYKVLDPRAKNWRFNVYVKKKRKSRRSKLYIPR